MVEIVNGVQYRSQLPSNKELLVQSVVKRDGPLATGKVVTVDRKSSHGTGKIRCGIYVRVSSEEGLTMSFTSLDNQEERARDLVRSRSEQGWVVSKVYRDGGISGGTLERAGLQQMLADVQQGMLDKIILYKLDRLSRRLKHFYTIIDIFEKHSVGLVSVTQSIDTSDAAGQLMLNILISFAEFELEQTTEHIQQKAYQTRKLGKRNGGRPILGYDIHPKTKALVVNQQEAAYVRGIFEAFIADPRVNHLARELQAAGVRQKTWVMRNGEQHEQRDITGWYLARLIENRTYIGEILYRRTGEVFIGEHEAIVDRETWERANALLHQDKYVRQSRERSTVDALLKYLVFCKSCNCRMRPKAGGKHRRSCQYYCANAYKPGAAACAQPSVPARELEAAVVDQLRLILRSDEVYAATCRAIDQEVEHRRNIVRTQLAQCEAAQDTNPGAVQEAEQLRTQLRLLDARVVTPAETAQLLAGVDAVWENLHPAERNRLVQLLVARVEVGVGELRLHLRDNAIASLARKLLEPGSEPATEAT